MKRSCERLWEVDALREGGLSAMDAASFARHREGCAECEARLASDERARELGQSLPHRPAGELHARRLRQRVLRAASTRAPRTARGVWLLAASLALMVVGALWGSRPAREGTPSLVGSASDAAPRAFGATLEPEAGARWTTAVEGTTERVVLEDGAVTLLVSHRDPGERFLVTLPDGEIEVKGTRFRVEVSAHATTSVYVFEGLVALRRAGFDEVLLGTNQTWQAPGAPAAAPASVAPAARVSASPVTARATQARQARSARPSLPVADDTTAYEAAVELFETHRYEEAARSLGAFVTAHGTSPEAEDATFLEASALARAGRGDAAGLAAERLLERYPRSLHMRDAATLAVRSARDRGDCRRARALAEEWLPEAARVAALGTCAAR